MTARNFPHYPTQFIGRSKELNEIGARLQQEACQILSLIGLGGFGKTRLAVQVALDQVTNFRDGATFVNLQAIQQADEIIIALAEALQFKFYDQVEPQQQILGFLSEKQMLLVLDNYEQLVPNFEFVINLIHSAPGVKILITSRESLNIQEEWLYPIQGLDFPEKKSPSKNDYDAIQLFASRARQVSPEFSLEHEWPHVFRICQLVEGVPLALELAATWLKSLSCEAVVHQIEKELDFLVTPLRNVTSRHRSMRAVFDSSWAMLSPEEQAAFMKLSIFQGGFSHEAAEAVTQAGPFNILSLVDKAFLRRMNSDRYQIHRLMRQYGTEKLKLSAEIHNTRILHSDYFLRLLVQHTEELKSHQQLPALNIIEADYSNIRLALEFAIEQSNHDPISHIVEGLYLFCLFRGYFQEGINLFENILGDALPPRIWGKVKSRQISLIIHAGLQGRHVWTAELANSLKIAQHHQDIDNIGFCLSTLGLSALAREDFTESIAYYQQALEAYRQLNDTFYIGRIWRQIGFVYLCQGKIKAAEAPLKQGLVFARQTGDRITMANCLYNLGSIAGFLDDVEGWFSAYREALNIRREVGDRANTALNLGGLAVGEFFRGRLEEALVLANEALDIASDINHQESKGQAYIWLGFLACVRESYDESVQLLENGLRLAPEVTKKSSAHLGLAMVACGKKAYPQARENMQTALNMLPLLGSWHLLPSTAIMAFILIHEGEVKHGLSAISLALHHPLNGVQFLYKWPFFMRLLEQLKHELGEETFATVWEHGKSLNVDKVVAGLLAQFTLDGQPHQQEAGIISGEMHAANLTLNEPLTPREHEILLLIASGLTNQQIAARLFIAPSTVKRHINHLYGKLAIDSRTKAIVKAQNLRLVPYTPPPA